MTDPSQSMELNTPLNLTPEEKRVFGELFRQADTEQMGVVTGEVAVKFFERTKLPPQILGEIWQIADTENRGLLTSSGFCQVLRLIGHFQAGKAPTPELAFQPGPLPKFDSSPPSGPAAPGPIQPQMSGPIRVPPLAPERAAQYAALFEKSGAVNGVLPGETAKNIFEKARLPNETLGRVWALADTEQRGALGVTEFIIAMHLIQSLSSGAMKGLPSSLPAGLYEAASRRGPTIRAPGAPQGPIPRQFSGQNTGRTQSPMSGRPQFATPPQSAQPTGNDWLITPQEKSSYDNLFSKVDTQGRGFITGEQAVVFFSDSGLPEEVLAAIWDLADINSEGQLNRDEFAVAMYLIRQQRPKPGVQFLPPSLPPALVPPSLRSNARPPTQAPPPATFGTAAPFPAPAAPAVPPPKSASEDLFGLDAFTASPPVQPQSTGGSAANFGVNKDPFGNGAASPVSPSRGTFQPTPQNPASIFKPFMPSSSFGQTLTAQGTGGSGSQPRSPAPPQPSAMDDLLGDNDQEQSKKLTDESAELGNMSNQINTLRTQMQETHNRKASTEAELNTTSAQKRDLETRLSQFRSQYEAEVQIVKQLEERLNASRQETRKLQQEMAMIEGSYQDLSSQHQQVASALDADQRENANLKERIRQTNVEIGQLRPQLDKMRSEARQQKGMVAINKKQLATNEGERDKLRNEMSELTKAAQESYNRSPEATPGPPTAGSPAPSNASHSTNPFFRRSPQPTENTMSPSGFSREASQASFDNFFGPSISSGQTSAPTTVPAFSAPSGQSVQSSEPGVPTPSTSPPLSQYHESPRVGEPPAPPESRQFSSSILPIREGAARQGSFSSSIKAAPPASRFGTGGNETPTNAPGSPSASTEPAKDTSAPEFGPSPFNRNFTSSPAASHVSDAARSASGAERKDTFQSFGPPSTSADMPGSFPEVSTPLQPEATGQSAMSDRSKGSFSFPRSDPFGSQPQRQGSTAKADFDAAFAGFGSGKQFQERQNTGSSLNGSVGSASKFNQEFPPIENLGGDDDSESNSEHGFDDNFAPSSPQAKRDETAPAPATSGPEGTGDSGNPFSRDTSNLPTPNAQKPPPTYEQTAGSRNGARGSDSFPPEFGGLLPSRQDPTAQSGSQSPEKTFSSPVLTPGQTLFGGSSAAGKAPATGPFSPGSTSNANTPSSTVPSDAYHSAQSYPSTDKAASPANQAPGKQSFGDDFDAGFDDLAEAKDDTNAHDDDDLFGSSHHEGLDEFNPVFDSPAASKSNTMASQATPTNNASKNHGEDSFSDFEHLTQSFASSKPATASGGASSHDWDAIFSGLSDSQPAPSTGGNTAPQTADNSQMLGAPEQAATGDDGEKPHLARALSAGTEHDDPILKNLTGMGYQRADALAALEKFDYDINKAVEFLSGK
ncbi:uba ts-n domain-containing protein [Diplodia corticola]|uniref:Uba ts-n domain-containing protein n=1 Tax=Diplodia corticola TaxID=236234 RepID=A0A1J9RTX8_9PEZI|nr:uba ts-n domain-containing protein [Diplodia corticola]OJD31879.1 uba ts-n domain-containing protein [Diplodia corticola]